MGYLPTGYPTQPGHRVRSLETPHYVAPEIFHYVDSDNDETNAYTNAVDTWYFACVVYEMLSHQVPFPVYPKDLKKFCSGGPFPDGPLARCTSEDGIGFIKLGMVPQPKIRLSAEDVLKIPWIDVEKPRTDSIQPRSLEDLKVLENEVQEAHRTIYPSLGREISYSRSEESELRELQSKGDARIILPTATGTPGISGSVERNENEIDEKGLQTPEPSIHSFDRDWSSDSWRKPSYHSASKQFDQDLATDLWVEGRISRALRGCGGAEGQRRQGKEHTPATAARRRETPPSPDRIIKILVRGAEVERPRTPQMKAVDQRGKNKEVDDGREVIPDIPTIVNPLRNFSSLQKLRITSTYTVLPDTNSNSTSPVVDASDGSLSIKPCMRSAPRYTNNTAPREDHFLSPRNKGSRVPRTRLPLATPAKYTRSFTTSGTTTRRPVAARRPLTQPRGLEIRVRKSVPRILDRHSGQAGHYLSPPQEVPPYSNLGIQHIGAFPYLRNYSEVFRLVSGIASPFRYCG